jgi:flagellar motor switch protein FliN/FliY
MVDPNESFSPEDFGLDDLDSEKELASGEQERGDVQARIAEENSPLSQIDLSRMKLVLDVPLKVSVELGRTKLLVNDLLQLGQGSVIELDKMAGEPMEIYVNDKLVAMGEVVVVNEKFGVRLTDVMSGVGFEDFGPRDVA